MVNKTSRQFHPENSIIDVAGIKFGGNDIVIIGGPCSVESEASICEIAKEIKQCGGQLLRGGAYKPRTSPYDFQGLGTDGILALEKAGKQQGLPIVSEIMSVDKIEEFEKHVDLIQVGARNMQNFELLKALGKVSKPILLKRGFSNTIDEWLMSAEYIIANGNPNVILCERGIRTFETSTRNTLDLSAICVVKEKSHLPILVDPSHGTGNANYVKSMALAAVAAGADGLIIEVHPHPECALSDGHQCITPKIFKEISDQANQIVKFLRKQKEE